METPTVINVKPYRIEFDGAHNWVVTKRVKAKQTSRTVNKEVDQHVAYRGTLESSLNAVLQSAERGLGEISTTSRHAITDALAEIELMRISLEKAVSKLAVNAIHESRLVGK